MTAVSRNRSVIVLAAAGSIVAIAIATLQGGAPPRIDLAVPPNTVFATVPFEVGATYTLGEARVPAEVKRPVTVTAVEILHARGIEVLGGGAYEPRPDSIGLVPGWPPQAPYATGIGDTIRSRVTFSGEVHTVVGIRTTAPKSGLRGIKVRWVDGDGVAGTRTFDLAVLTCAPGACHVDSADPDPMLRELGLLR